MSNDRVNAAIKLLPTNLSEDDFIKLAAWAFDQSGATRSETEHFYELAAISPEFRAECELVGR
jgi:hypothetical protein